MRGSPPLHLVLFIIGFALLAVPLSQLTFARPAAPVAAPKEETGKTRTHIRFRFAHVPLTVSVKLDGHELLTAKFSPPSRTTVEFESELAIPKEGIDLETDVTWPDGTPDTAFAIELEPDGLDPQTQTHWSKGARMSGKIYTFEWKP